MGYDTFSRLAIIDPSYTDSKKLKQCTQLLQDYTPLAQVEIDIIIEYMNNDSLKSLEEYAKTTKLPVLQYCKWYDSEDYVKVISLKFPNLIFALLYTGESQELCYCLINKGKATNYIDFDLMKDQYINKFDGEDEADEADGRIEEICRLCLVQKIEELGMIDVSALFEDMEEIFYNYEWNFTGIESHKDKK